MKAFQFLNEHLQPILRSRIFYIKDTDFFSKLKNLNKAPDIGIMVTGNIVGLFTNIPNNEGPEILKKLLDSFDEKSIPRTFLK